MALLIIPFIVFLLFTLQATLLRKRTSNHRRRRLPPGPPPLPFIGNLHEFIGELPHVTLRKLSRKYGPLIHVKLGQVPTIVASSPETAAEVLKTQDIVFCGRPFFATTDRFSYGGLDIAFAPYNDHWRRIRRFANAEVFSAARVEAFKAIREEEVGALLKTISTASAKGEAFNLSTMMLCLFNNLVYRVVFGKRISAASGDCGRSRHHEMIMEAVSFTTELCVGDFFPSLGGLDGLTGWRRRLEKIFRAMDRVFEVEIEERVKIRGSQKENGGVGDACCFLDILLRSQQEMDDSLGLLLTRDVIKAILMTNGWLGDYFRQLLSQSHSLFGIRELNVNFLVATPKLMAARGSANYQPSSWDYSSLQTLPNARKKEVKNQLVEELMQEVRQQMNDNKGPKRQLEIIEAVDRLGLASLFQRDIYRVLSLLSLNNCEVVIPCGLRATAICFRLLRRFGFQISDGIFDDFME